MIYDNISECILPWVSPWFHWQFLVTCTFPISLKFGECYMKCQWVEFSVKNAFLYLHIHFCHFCCFLSQICVFMILWFLLFFSFFLHFSFFLFFFFFFSFFEVPNFQNRILTNQKPEMTIRNCHWNFMFGWKVAINSAMYYNSSFPLLLLLQKLIFLTDIFHVFW